MNNILQTGLLAVMLAAIVLASGCASPSADENASELPWNSQQAWESSPMIPGMSGAGNY